MTACFFKCVNHIQYAVAMSCSQVVYTNFRFFFQFLQCFYMTYCQVYYMDVITYAGSIRSIIVITEYSQAFQFADGNLCNIRKQVVRDSFRIFTDHAALMCSDWVEVTKQDNIPFRICSVQVCQDLFQHPFGPSIRVGTGSFRAFFCDRNKCRISVNGCGRTEDNIFYTVISHGIAEIQGTCDIIFIVFDRFYYRFSNGFQTCKMNHCIYFFFVEDVIHCLFITDVCIVEYYFLSCDFFYSVQSFLTCVIKVVHYNNVVTCIQQFHACMASDITSSTCN